MEIQFLRRYRERKEWEEIEKSFKYLRRFPKANGKGYNYVYKDSWKKPFKALLECFGIKREKLDKDYTNNNIKKDYGADKQTFAAHVLEYFTHKIKWDKIFSKKEARTKYKKPVQQKDVVRRVAAESRVKSADPNKMPVNRSLMRKVWSMYSTEGQRAVIEESESEAEKHSNRSNAMKGNKNAKKDGVYTDHEGDTNGKDNTGINRGRLSDHSQNLRGGSSEGTGNKNVLETGNGSNGSQSTVSSNELGNGSTGSDSDVNRGRGRITKAQARKIREQCREILKKSDDEITEADKEILAQYVGAGGADEKGASNNGILYEFYTPRNVISKVWQLVDKYNPRQDKTVIEPSSGIGRFAEGRNEDFTMFELEEESARIAHILHPNAEVVQGAFQTNFMKQYAGRFTKKDFKKYDVAVGNPPYGDYTGRYKGEGEGRNFRRYESYFMARTLDTLKDGGIMAMVVPSGFLDAKKNGKTYGKDLEKIAEKAKILEAWRLPNGTFDSTDVGTDIIVFKKGAGGNADDFRNYFTNNPDHVAGEKATRSGRFGEEEYIKVKNGETFESAVDSIDVGKVEVEKEVERISKDVEVKVKKTDSEKKANRSKAMEGNKNAEGKHNYPISKKAHIIDAEEFNKKYGKNIDKSDLDIWKITDKFGNVDMTKLSDKQKEYVMNSNHYVNENGIYTNVVNYASGNVRQKLQELDENDPQYELKKSLLEEAIPEERKIGQFTLSPITDWTRNYVTKDGTDLITGFFEWVYNGNGYYSPGNSPVSQEEIPPEISFYDVIRYINREPVRLDRGEREDDKKANDRLKYRKKEKRQETANRLFNRYLAEGLSVEDQKDLTKEWNDNFNAYKNPDYTKIPIFVDGMCSHKGEKEFTLSKQQIKGVTQLTNKGTGLLAYDVGVGKTAAGIVATVNQIQTGRAKKPLICVPKPTYKNWIKSLHQLFPNIKVNELGNLSKSYISDDFTPEAGSISVCTYEGIENIGFNDAERQEIQEDVEFGALWEDSGDKKVSKRQAAKKDETMIETVGGMSRTRDTGIQFSQLGFDHITVDEVHNFRNLFAAPRRMSLNNNGEEEDTKSQANEFGSLGGGKPSARAQKLFAITQLVQRHNDGRNTFLLSATPFQNSPIEIYSILSYMARDKLKKLGIYSLEQFVGQFCKLQSEYVVKANKIDEKLVMKDFNNLRALQNLITEYIDKVDGEEAGVIRPYKRTHTPELELTDLQKAIMDNCNDYIDEQEQLPKNDRDPGYMFRAMNAMRNCALSPALVSDDFIPVGTERPPMNEIVESSPKLKFVCDSIASQYKKNSHNGQVMYMPSGVEQFPQVRDYLVRQGVPKDAIALMSGGATSDKAMDARQAVLDEFNNVDGKCKVIIGSSTIKEGVNMQGNSTTIYNTQLDWNPTDAQQLEGRIWRQGNKQGVTHIVYPLMHDSIDSMIYQKYDEKSSRLNALFEYKGDALNVSDINPEELKFGLIKDPKKRASMQVAQFTEKAKGDQKLYAQLIDVLHKQNDIAFESDEEIKHRAEMKTLYGGRIDKIQEEYEKFGKEKKAAEKTLADFKKATKGKGKDFNVDDYAMDYPLGYFGSWDAKTGEEGLKVAISRLEGKLRGITDSYESSKRSVVRFNKEYKKYINTKESTKAALAAKGINTTGDVDAKIQEYVNLMDEARNNVDKAKDMYDDFYKAAVADNLSKQKDLLSVDEQVELNVESIMNDLHPMDDELRAKIKAENEARNNSIVKKSWCYFDKKGNLYFRKSAFTNRA